MANMSYCRFQNTVMDLEDCVEALEDKGFDALSEDEQTAACRMKRLCKTFIQNMEDEGQ